MKRREFITLLGGAPASRFSRSQIDDRGVATRRPPPRDDMRFVLTHNGLGSHPAVIKPAYMMRRGRGAGSRRSTGNPMRRNIIRPGVNYTPAGNNQVASTPIRGSKLTSGWLFVSNKQERALKLFRALTAAGFIAAAASAPAVAIDISGAGATFPYPIYAKWADAYKKETNIGLNYQSIGSGGGIKQIKAKTVTFGASDAPRPGKELDESGLIQFPMVMGGIVPVVNIEGIKSGDLVIDGPTLAKIFLGEIKTWNDPAIAKLNPSAKLPSQPIAVVHRSDGSGTTYNFAYYLAEVSPEWKSKVGFNTSVEWPVGIGAKGNEGVANNVAQTKGSIGYVEYAYAKQNKLTHTKMINKD